jgi:5'-nucleotidase
MARNLIIVTNDDGVKSPGLLAAVRVLRGLGELVVVAPREQQSSSGRAFYWRDRGARKQKIVIGRQEIPAYSVDASPAVVVRFALMLVATRRPSLVVSGINYGENLGSGLTISGTVGAALEAAADGIPALAVSLETDKEYHLSHSAEVDFRAAAYFCRFVAERMLRRAVPEEVPLVNINVPRDATRDTPWRVTRASHQAYFRSTVNNGRFTGYDVSVERDSLEPDSDIHAILVDRVVSISPLTFDLTARTSMKTFEQALQT